MRSKNSAPITKAESHHMLMVKETRCVTCDAPYSEAHHIRQGLHYLTVALCSDCHRGPLGIHGNKTMLKIKHWDELDALNETLRRLAD